MFHSKVDFTTLKNAISYEKLLYVLLFLFGVTRLFTPPVDPDFGWHYKYGEYMVKNHAFLNQNNFSYNLPDYQWISSYWISQILLYVTHYNLGHILAGILFSALLTLYVFRFIKSKASTTSTLIVCFIFFTSILAENFNTVRPLFFNTFFWLAVLEILVYRPSHKKYLPLVFLLWPNFHAEFTIGIFVVSLYFLNLFYRNIKDKKYKTLGLNLLILVLCYVATFVNPFGINLWTTLLGELTQPTKAFVQEWKPPSAENPLPSLYALILLPISLIYGVNKKQYWYAFLGVFFALFTLKSIYMGRLLVIFALPSLIWFVDVLSFKFGNIAQTATQYLLYGLCVIYFALFIKNIGLASNFETWSKQWHYPYNAVSILKTTDKTANLFNWYRWGGYLIWQLPEYKTFVDGRMTAWKSGENYFMEDYLKIRDHPEENADLVEKYFVNNDIGYVLDSPQSPLVNYLTQKGWLTLYQDDYSILLQRQSLFAKAIVR